jgi:NAD+ synthase
MKSNKRFSAEDLKLDAEMECLKITNRIKNIIPVELKRQGAVVAISGGIDSSVVASLCVRALGPERVVCLMMPERDSSADTLGLSTMLADHLKTRVVHEDISSILTSVGCYKRRDDSIREVLPEYDESYKFKIVLPSVTESDVYRLFSIVARTPGGKELNVRLTPAAYLGIVAATNFKQRVRKMLEYYHADRLNYAVAGTPNRLEYDQGFFVKLGDGAADFKPIAHLYKTQVYELAEYLGVPHEIRKRRPTTDTYSLSQSQEEFYFSLPYEKMDLCLYGKNNNIPQEEVSQAAGITVDQLKRVYHDIDQKRRTTRYLHMSPVLMENIPELH